jgi:acetolactate synthase-1/2/3 large subunit
MRMRVADYITKFIYDIGVKDVFILTGGGIMHLTDGLACNKKLKVYCLHHEQSVSMAIETYARTTGNFGVGYFTTGPGATNAITGLAGAYLDSSPCLYLSGQAKRSECVFKTGIPGIRQIGVQEINILPVVESMTNYAAFVDQPEDIRYHLEKAYCRAKTGRPGPVWLDIPLDVQGAIIDTEKLRGYEHTKVTKKPSRKDINDFLQMLKTCKRPVILAGQGVRIAGAIQELTKYARKLNIPVVTTFLGIDIIESRHPNYAGRLGIKGTRAGNLAIQNCDLLLAIGTSFPVAEIGYDCSQFARGAKKIIVDVDKSSHLRKGVPKDLLIEGDAKEFLKSIRHAQKPFNKEWLKRCIEWREKYPVCEAKYGKLRNKINIYHFIDKLCDRLNKDDIVVTDAGSSFYAGSQAVKIKKGMRYITSGGFATMGFSLPASIGVCAANNKRRVMCITGDGSFQQNIQELQAVKQYKLPIKIFVINNGGYLSIRYTQSRYFQRYIGEGPKSGVTFPDCKKIAWAYGIKFLRAKNNRHLPKALNAALRHKGPVLCEVMTPQNQLIIPTLASYKNEDGTMVSRPLEDMFPFLPRKEFNSNMIIKPLNE